MFKQNLIDRSGKPIVLGSELGKGGEGAVYHIDRRPDLVAKIYIKSPDQEKSYKIMNMIGASNDRLLKLAAWPIDSVHARSGELIGFVMQKLQGYRPLFELYSPKLRLQEFPKADWRFLIHAATNTARAFCAIHEAGHVIGDVNHGNLLVANDATVKFIDTDSFQISVGGQHWLCEVGVATHQPPEMQGLSTYKGIIRTPNHDNFGLAVLIFQLLCLARHPFSGRFLSAGDMPLETAIAEYRFAYARDSRLTLMAPPPASLAMNALSSKIGGLFERAFTKSSLLRPTAKEWIPALEELATLLKTCQTNQGHYYLKTLSSCPWCDIELKSSSILFPVIVQNVTTHQGFELLWKQVLAIQSPGTPPPLPDLNSVSAIPSKEAKEIGKKVKKIERRTVGELLIAIVVSIGILVVWGFNVWHLIILGGTVWSFVHQNAKKSKLIIHVEQQLKTAKNAWNQLTSNWEAWTSASAFTIVRQEVNELRKKYDVLPKERQCRMQELWNTRREQQLHAHLDRYRICNAQINGIGAGRTITLQSYGIETAADLNHAQLELISGFGPKLIRRLFDWQRQCELAFVFDAAKGVSQLEIQKVDRDISTKRFKLEQELSKKIGHLKVISHQIMERRKQIHSQGLDLIHAYVQAAVDAHEVGMSI